MVESQCPLPSFIDAIEAIDKASAESPAVSHTLVKMSRYARLAIHAWCLDDQDAYLIASQRFSHYWSSPVRSTDIDERYITTLARAVTDPATQVDYIQSHYASRRSGLTNRPATPSGLYVLDLKGVQLNEAIPPSVSTHGPAW